MNIGDIVSIYNEATGRYIQGTVIGLPLYKINLQWSGQIENHYLISWEKNAGPLVSRARLYADEAREIEIKKQARRDYLNAYRMKKRGRSEKMTMEERSKFYRDLKGKAKV